MSTSSWRDDHMPEMLWAALLAEVFDRENLLGCFRGIVDTCAGWFAATEGGSVVADVDVESIDYALVLDQTGLAELTDEQFAKFAAVPLRHPLGYAALRPLLLIESLPAFDRWKRLLAVDADSHDWGTLGSAVAAVIDHQSQRSTDIRWFKVMLPIVAGRVQFPYEMKDHVEELFNYPNKGDMRSVRPSIRALEMSMRRSPPRDWVEMFWAEMHTKTRCVDPTGAAARHEKTSLEADNFYASRQSVISAFHAAVGSTRTDARLDASFGLVLYAFSIMEEVASSSLQKGILGQLSLRALVEANITLKYLAKKDDAKLWASYRVYGAGQAKLAFLKLQEVEGDLPSFVDESVLFEIANEDTWQEFLEIDIGHWTRSNLRSLAQECGAKELYDKYYGWSSSYVHAHWGAVRDTNFVTCHNPLHRLHRIPRLLHRPVSSVEGDEVFLLNEMIQLLRSLYPGCGELPMLGSKEEPA